VPRVIHRPSGGAPPRGARGIANAPAPRRDGPRRTAARPVSAPPVAGSAPPRV